MKCNVFIAWLGWFWVGACSVGMGGVIHEVMGWNEGVLFDEFGEASDWIELFNESSQPMDLSGVGLSDDRNDPFQWRFPDGVSLPPHDFLLVYASGRDLKPRTVVPWFPGGDARLQVWLRADQIDPLDSQVVDETNLGLRVKRWRNSLSDLWSGMARTELARPLLLPSGRDAVSFPRVLFDGVDDELQLPDIPARNSFTWVAVLRSIGTHEVDPVSRSGTGGTSGQHYLLGALHGGELDGGTGVSVGENGISVYEHGSGYMPCLGAFETGLGRDWMVLAIQWVGRVASVYGNGIFLGKGEMSPRRFLWASSQIGAGAYGAFQGEVAEVLLFSGVLSETEIQGVSQDRMDHYQISGKSSYHTNFKINADGERLILTHPSGHILDQVQVPEFPGPISYGRSEANHDEFRWFAEPTPGRPNSTPGLLGIAGSVEFSHNPGVYHEELHLSLASTSGRGVIRYTTNGVVPDERSPVYSVPLRLSGQESDPSRQARTQTGASWREPRGTTLKVPVIRARVFEEGYLPGKVATGTFLIYPPGKKNYRFAVLSLVTDRKHFFDAETGIYVPGDSPEGNYWERGEAWERPIHLELMETNGLRVLGQDARVRIHGGTSRQFPQKNLRFYGEDDRGRKSFRYPLFPGNGVERYERFILRASGHDHHFTFFRDALMQKIVDGVTHADLQGYRPVVTLLNGEYWGLYNLRESLDPNYFSSHYGVDPDEVDLLEGHTSVNEGSAEGYLEMMDRIRQEDVRVQEVYDSIQEMMDVDNFVDYRITEIFFYRWDTGNIKYWRGGVEQPRWRWALFDMDVGFGGFASIPRPWEFDMLAYDTEANGPWNRFPLNDHNHPEATYLLRRLLENEEFKRHFIQRTSVLVDRVFDPDRVLEWIDLFETLLEEEMPEHIRRWTYPESMDEWRRRIEDLRTFARMRPLWVYRHWIESFKLKQPVELGLRVRGGRREDLRIEGYALKEGDFSIRVFPDIPFKVEVAERLGGIWYLKGGSNPVGEERMLKGDGPWMEILGEPGVLEFEWRPEIRFERLPGGGLRVEVSDLEGVLEESDDLIQWVAVDAEPQVVSGKKRWETKAEKYHQFFRYRMTED